MKHVITYSLMPESKDKTNDELALSDLAIQPPDIDPLEEQSIEACILRIEQGMGSQQELRNIHAEFGHTTFAAAIARKRARDLLKQHT